MCMCASTVCVHVHVCVQAVHVCICMHMCVHKCVHMCDRACMNVCVLHVCSAHKGQKRDNTITLHGNTRVTMTGEHIVNMLNAT